MMKKQKISFETNFWIRYEAGSARKVIDAFFENDNLVSYKQMLGEALMYTRKRAVYQREYPGTVFVFYKALHSLLKACHCLQFKSWEIHFAAASGCGSILHQASLTNEEYADPYLVFRNAFAFKTLAEFDFFLCDTVELALSHYTEDDNWDVMAFYIHLVKMLDAAQLIHERDADKVERFKK